MKVLSLFSGVGGFDMGLEAAGMTTAFQCEIDKHARSVLDHHWHDVPKWDDVTTLTGAYILEQTGGVDLVAWGSPCQDLSLAGKRAGLSGERSGLFHEGIRIIKELRELSNGQYPTWSIWENVYGALSSNRGADFGQVLYEMDEAGACFSEWAVLDAQYFGVPQRRRRVFVASCFDFGVSERCGSPLFPVSESVSRYLAPRITQGENTSNQVTDSVGTGSEPISYSIREDAKANNFSATEIETARALQALQPSVQSHHAQTFITQPLLLDGRRVDDVRVYTEPVQTLQERMGTGGNNVPVVAQEHEPIVFQPGTMIRLNGGVWEGGPAPTLRAYGKSGDNEPHVMQEQHPIVFSHTQGLDAQPSTEYSPTLRTEGNGMAVAQEKSIVIDRSAFNTGFDFDRAPGVEVSDTTPTLVARGPHAVGQETYVKSRRAQTSEDVETWIESDVTPTLNVFDVGDTRTTTAIIEPTLIVRRLTPLECERLMGWPDNHTAVGINGHISDTNRYKMCGNGVASPVAQWLATHILKATE